MNRTTTRTSGDRVVASLSRGIIRTINDSPYMQELGVRIRDQQDLTEVEHWHSAGVTHYPMPPDAKGAAEIILATLTGNNSHPIALPAADRRFRPNGMRPGDTAVADANKQTIHLNEVSVVLDSPKRFDLRVTSGQGEAKAKNQGADLNTEKKPSTTITGKATGTLATTSTDATTVTGKTVGLTAGTKPEAAGNHELNQQLKGVVAQLTQLKDSHHALFDVVSKLRANAESVVPALAPVNAASQVTAALSGAVGGLDVMKALASGKLQDYFQNAIKTALQDFLNPARMMGAASVMSGGVEGLIAQAQAQIAGLIAQNPVAAQVDGLLSRIEALADAPLPPDIAGAATAVLQAQVDYLVRQNPVVGQVQQLRGALQAMIDGAGPGLGFLAPQQRLVQGLTRSMLFSKS
ncbi:phage baseplate assembly protein domain-containing protein [Methylobacterium fujisawaense]|uniref:phage baseplate assembly protein domain-containing protein n=1 Tax=Methylobacterium fujisawaense TaxID=107400 RepID=UPI003CED31DF